LERFVGERLRVARRAEQILERAMPQESEIVRAFRKLLRHLGAQRTQRLEIVAAQGLRMALAQPRQQRVLGGGDERTRRPQGVVQIEAQYERSGHRHVYY